MELPDPAALAPALQAVLAGVVDPRRRRGVRHPLVVVLTAAVCAVAAGARSFVAAAEWVADLPAEVAAALGVADRCPSESAIRRLLGRVDADRFDTVIGGFVQGLCASAAPAGRRRVLAVDGKTVRGSRHTDAGGVAQPGRHLLAVIDQHSRVVLGQVKVEGKTNEVRHEAPCRIPDSVRRNLEDRFLGPMAYPDPKGDGDQSMPGIPAIMSRRRSDASGDPRDMAKLRREALCRIPDAVGKNLEGRS